MTTEALGESLIPVINKLQDIFSQVTLDFKLDLPQVAVVGSQSSGKSSVLEALVGRDFLPRGPDICTRRPLVLQLVKTPAGTDSEGDEWGEFLHAKGKRFYDFEKIREEIATETDRVAGHSKDISDTPIRLKICSPNVLTMTLVDLPGITRVPVGDQPEDIEMRIREMIEQFVRHPTCIILAVSPANVDLANSDALQMAQSVDPEGKRTIGVLTKLDIMDRGTNAVPVLRNQVVPLRLGYIGIVNRSQDDINKKRNMMEARRNEADFFKAHLEYRDVRDQCGTQNLAKRLNSILVTHIQTLLPGLRRQISLEMEKRTVELRDYGEAPPSDSTMGRGAMLLGVLSEYCQRFAAMLDGRSESVLVDLAGGAKIRDIFQNQFVKVLRNMDWRNDLSSEVIRTTIRNSSGVSGSLLIPQEPFELLVRRSIKRLLEPSLRCKELVQDELLRIASDCAPKELSRFATLQKAVTDAVAEYIRAGGDPAEQFIRGLIDCEYDYINYDHPDFIGGSNAVAEVLADKKMRTAHRAESASRDGSEGNGEARRKLPSDGHPQPMVVRNVRGGRVEPVAAPGKLGLKSLFFGRSKVKHGAAQSKRKYSQHEAGNSASPPSQKRMKGLNDAPGLAAVNRNDNLGPRGLGGLEGGVPDEANSSGWFSSFFARNDQRQDGVSGLDTPVSPLNSMSALAGGLDSTAGVGLVDEGRDMYGQMDIAVAITRKLVDNYMSLVQNNVSDMVPKTVMHFLVHRSRRGLQQHLIGTLYKEDLFSQMMSEREDVMIKRKNCQTALQVLKEAMVTLDTLPQELHGGAGSDISLPSPVPPRRVLSQMDRQASMTAAARAAQNIVNPNQATENDASKSNPFEFPS